MGPFCSCLSFGFTGIRCQAGYYDFYLSGYENGRPSYLGTIMSVEYKVFWDGTQWGFQQTDPSFPEIAFFSTVDTFNICELIGSDWQIGDITNFPIICTFLSGLDVALIDCPSIPCNCYETTIPENCDGVEIGYLDCSDNIVSFIGYKNETYNFCSKIVPTANCRPSLLFLLKGECTNGQCPQPVTTTTTIPITTTTTTFFPLPNTPLEPTNECDVITIFPMGVECISVDPSFTDTFDGSASLYITGGTPPYEILWENGSVGTTINNLGVGKYKATVTDSYGDFLITSTCILSAETPSPTTTTTSTTPPISFNDLCVIYTRPNGKFFDSQFSDFIYDGIYNEKPSWLSSDGNYFIYWNTGTTEEWLISGNTSFVVYNPNPDTPPLNGWQILGAGKTTITVVEGSCDNLPPLSMQLTSNNPSCGSNGSIIVSASGGIPPYLYSKDGGSSFQYNPIFNNLAGGNYSIVTKDSTGTLQTQIVTLISNSSPTTYNLTLNRSGNNLSVNINPPLPNGVNVIFDLITNSQFSVAPLPTSAVNSVGANILVNGSPITPNSPVINNITTTNLCNGTTFITTTSSTWPNITLNNTSTFSGTLFNTLSPVLPLPSCYAATSNTDAYINNAKIQGCECCNVFIVQEGRGRALGLNNIPII